MRRMHARTHVCTLARALATAFALALAAGCSYAPVVTNADGAVNCPPVPIYAMQPNCDQPGALCTYPMTAGCNPTCRCVQAEPTSRPVFVCQPCASGP